MSCSVFCVGDVEIKDACLRATWQKSDFMLSENTVVY